MKTGALFVGVTLLADLPLGAEPELNMRVSPMVAAAPATVRIEITVPPDADNRAIAIAADGDAFYRSSWVPLDGDTAPRIITLEYRNVPWGDYEIRGVLFSKNGKPRAVTSRSLIVTGLQ